MVVGTRIATPRYGVGYGGQAWLMEGITGTEKPQLSEESLGLVMMIGSKGRHAFV